MKSPDKDVVLDSHTLPVGLHLWVQVITPKNMTVLGVCETKCLIVRSPRRWCINTFWCQFLVFSRMREREYRNKPPFTGFLRCKFVKFFDSIVHPKLMWWRVSVSLRYPLSHYTVDWGKSVPFGFLNSESKRRNPRGTRFQKPDVTHDQYTYTVNYMTSNFRKEFYKILLKKDWWTVHLWVDTGR